MLSRIRNLLIPHVDDEVVSSIMNENVRHIQKISLIVAILEAVILGILAATSGSQFMALAYTRSSMQVIFCMTASILVWIFMRDESTEVYRTRKQRTKLNGLVGAYILCLLIWGMVVSQSNYAIGSQMITFYVVEVITLCFVTIPPVVSFFTTFVAFTVFYVIMINTEAPSAMNPVNYFAFAVACWIGAIALYHMSLRNHEQVYQVRQLNSQLNDQVREVRILNDRLNELSSQDGLTGLGNRLALREYFTVADGRTLAVMMADVDDFKKINDDFSHDVGDSVLLVIADELRAAFPDAHLFRFGGDEFLVIQENCTQEAFETCRNTWKNSVEQKQIPGMDRPVHVSSGIVIGNPPNEVALRDLMHEADLHLYEMKQMKHTA